MISTSETAASPSDSQVVGLTRRASFQLLEVYLIHQTSIQPTNQPANQMTPNFTIFRVALPCGPEDRSLKCPPSFVALTVLGLNDLCSNV